MTSWNEKTKKKLDTTSDKLAKKVEELKKHAEKKEWDKALERAQEAWKLKQTLVALIPDLILKGVNPPIPFFPVYDMYYDLDILFDKAKFLLGTKNTFASKWGPDLTADDIIARLKVLAQELEWNLLAKSTWPKNSQARKRLEELIQGLKDLIRKLREHQEGKKIDIAPRRKDIVTLKINFLNRATGGIISFWSVYRHLFGMDWYLSFAASAISRKKLEDVLWALKFIESGRTGLGSTFEGVPFQE